MWLTTTRAPDAGSGRGGTESARAVGSTDGDPATRPEPAGAGTGCEGSFDGVSDKRLFLKSPGTYSVGYRLSTCRARRGGGSSNTVISDRFAGRSVARPRRRDHQAGRGRTGLMVIRRAVPADGPAFLSL